VDVSTINHDKAEQENLMRHSWNRLYTATKVGSPGAVTMTNYSGVFFSGSAHGAWRARSALRSWPERPNDSRGLFALTRVRPREPRTCDGRSTRPRERFVSRALTTNDAEGSPTSVRPRHSGGAAGEPGRQRRALRTARGHASQRRSAAYSSATARTASRSSSR
jgi:hypothetical protein